MTRPTPADAESWLRAHRHGTPASTALDFVDSLPAVPVPAMTGRWRGAGWHTGHPWDGVLEALGWWGKEVLDAERVRPLLMRDAVGDPVAVDPALAPVTTINAWPGLFRTPAAAAAFRLVRPLLRSTQPGGRLRVVEHRGTPTAALVYDRVPIVDAFRRVTDDLVVGAADIRGQDAPLLFVLRRAEPRQPSRPPGGDRRPEEGARGPAPDRHLGPDGRARAIVGQPGHRTDPPAPRPPEQQWSSRSRPRGSPPGPAAAG